MRKTKGGPYLVEPICTPDSKFSLLLPGNSEKFPGPEFFIHNELLGQISFGKAEVEWAAKLLVRFFNRKGGWNTFTLEELSTFCKGEGEKSASAALFGLICGWYDDGGPWGTMRNSLPYIIQHGEEFVLTTTFMKRLMPNGITIDMIKPIMTQDDVEALIRKVERMRRKGLTPKEQERVRAGLERRRKKAEQAQKK